MAELMNEPEVASAPRHSAHASGTAQQLIQQARVLADELALRPNLGLNTAPRRELERFAELGLLTAPLPTSLGGLGLGIEPGTQLPLLRLLAIAGSTDLALGRIFEGHVNGLLLVHRFGTVSQLEQLAEDCRGGMLSGVWNTGGPEPLKLHRSGDAFTFAGIKTFATGASFIQRPIVTAELDGAELDGGAWQMTLPPMESIAVSLDHSFWHPLGMESSESFQIDFTGASVARSQLIGAPGDYYLNPMFLGGAVRFASVQAGAILRLHSVFAAWLHSRRQAEDPYQIARLGEVSILAQEAVLWVERAAAVAEETFFSSDKQNIERMIECAHAMRLAIEHKATRVMQLVTAGVGARGLLQPHRFERVIRDLTMYLRQPAPDQTLAALGRAALDKQRCHSTGTQWGLWSNEASSESMPSTYFDEIYQRERDPWNFETSPYEKEKYVLTLASLPRPLYSSALEVGCSIGVLTERLAARCQHLLSLDVSQQALERAAIRCAALSSVQFKRMQIPNELPTETFDLIVISEVAYYWQPRDLEKAADALAALHRASGHLILVHWTEPVPDYPLTGDEVHDFWLSRPEWRSVTSLRRPQFRLDVLERLPVAE